MLASILRSVYANVITSCSQIIVIPGKGGHYCSSSSSLFALQVTQFSA